MRGHSVDYYFGEGLSGEGRAMAVSRESAPCGLCGRAALIFIVAGGRSHCVGCPQDTAAAERKAGEGHVLPIA